MHYAPRRFKKAPVVLGLLGVVVLAGAAYGGFLLLHHADIKSSATIATKVNKPAASHPNESTKPAAQSPTIRLLATGDFIAHDTINLAAKQADGSYDYLPMMQDFVPIFQKADIRFCNDPILNGGAEFGIAGYPKFNSPTAFVTDMGRLGCNLVNTASNHSFDHGQGAISASVDAWQSVPNMLAVAGENRTPAEHNTVHYFTKNGVKFAFLAYTAYVNNDAPVQNDYGLNVFSKGFASSQIATAKQAGAKFIIVSMRWGTEYSTTMNAQQKQLAQWLADQGVGLVLGHGSHELQPVQWLDGADGHETLVWYSLGNFINTQLPPETLFNGLAFMDIDTRTLAITDVRYLPIYMHYEWTAAQASRQNGADLLARHNVHLYLLEDATQTMINSQQLHTTIAAQKARMQQTLDAYTTVPLITSNQL